MFADVRFAFRTLIKSPGFSAIAITTIALGIAANTAIFSVVNGVLLRPLPFRDEARIVQVATTTRNERDGNHSPGDFMDLKSNNRTLEALAGLREDVVAVAAGKGEPALLPGAWVTSEFFDVLGTPPALGRPFTRVQGDAAGEKLAVLSESAWQQLFGTDAGAIGRTVRVSGEPFIVAAVMPKAFHWPQSAQIWMLSPLAVPPAPIQLTDPLTNRDVSYFQAIARIKPGVSLVEARQDLHVVATTIQQQYPKASGGRDLRATPIRENLVGGVREALLVIQAAVGLVLLIACANVSSLLIARATGRRRELAIRAALGAGRRHLIRQLLAESVVLGVAGGTVGLLLSSWLIVLLVRLLPRGLPRTDAISLDATVIFVSMAASLAVSLIFGILPALQASRTRAAQVIKSAGERGSSRARGRAALVIAEIALTLVLLVGAGLLANSFVRLQKVDTGFKADHVTIGDLMVPQARYPKAADQTRLYRQLLDGLGGRPEVQAVGIGFPGPFRASSASATFLIEGRPSATKEDRPFAHIGAVSGGYFAAMGIPLLAGRTFAETDGESAPPVAIISASMAQQYWPGESAIGKHLRFDDSTTEPWFTVVGLVGDVHQLGVKEQAPALLFMPYPQFPLPFTSVAVRSSLPERDVVALMKSRLASVDKDLPFGTFNSLQSKIDQDVDGPRFRAMLMATFASLALLLAAVGVFGLISYTVTQRTREIGIRVALGAAPRQVLLPVIREGITLALAGVALGLVGAFAATRALTAFLFGVSAGDPITFALVAALLLAVATAASYLPSRRALKVDPMIALRAE